MHELTGSHEAWTKYQRLLELETAFAAKVWPSFLEPLRTRAQFRAMMQTAEEGEAWEGIVEQPLGRREQHRADRIQSPCRED